MSAQRKTVVVTGAAGQLGRAVAEVFRQRGFNLVLLDRLADRLASAAADAVTDALAVPLDLLDRTQVRTAIDQAVARFGGIDVLCHLAGGFRMGEAGDQISDASWDFLLDLNARTLVHVAQAVVRVMLERGCGKIVTVGAGAAQRGAAQMGAYCAS